MADLHRRATTRKKRLPARAHVAADDHRARGQIPAIVGILPTSLDGRDASHPLVQGRHFYTVPSDLLEAVVSEVGEVRFDQELLRLERELGRINGDHTSRVGFWNNRPIVYGGLCKLAAPRFSEQQVRRARLDPATIEHALRLFEERDRGPLERHRKGYLGWLLTDDRFLEEHDRLLSKHLTVARRAGTAHAGLFASANSGVLFEDLNQDPQWRAFNEDCQTFFTRWRLSGLAGPYLPAPLEPLLAGVHPTAAVSQHLMNTGGIFYLPDTMPIPSRDELRGLLDHALHAGAQEEHLEEWFAIIRAGNTARNKMDRFARIFEVQHFWRVLHARHQSVMVRQIAKIQGAFARIFKVDQSTIHQDLIQIRKRLGRDWLRGRGALTF